METVNEKAARLEGELYDLSQELRAQQIYNRTLDQMNHSAWKTVAKYRKILVQHNLLKYVEHDD